VVCGPPAVEDSLYLYKRISSKENYFPRFFFVD